MKAGRWIMVAAVALAASGCGDEDEASGTVTPEPEQQAAGPAVEEGAEPSEVQGAEQAAEEAGPVVEDPAFELRADAEGPYANGELGQFAITLTPRSGWKVNEEFPISVEIEAPEQMGLTKNQLEREDTAEFGEERARFDVPFTPTGAGEHRVNANVSFAVCTPENCIPDERTLALVVPVQ